MCQKRDEEERKKDNDKDGEKREARIRLKTIPHAYGLVLLTAAAA